MAPKRGYIVSDETKAKISKANKGRKRSEEFKAKCRERDNLGASKRTNIKEEIVKPKALSNEEWFAIVRKRIENGG